MKILQKIWVVWNIFGWIMLLKEQIFSWQKRIDLYFSSLLRSITYGGMVSRNSEYKFIKESLFDLVYSCSVPDSLFHMDLCLFWFVVVTYQFASEQFEGCLISKIANFSKIKNSINRYHRAQEGEEMRRLQEAKCRLGFFIWAQSKIVWWKWIQRRLNNNDVEQNQSLAQVQQLRPSQNWATMTRFSEQKNWSPKVEFRFDATSSYCSDQFIA